ncbi:hypothetical protein DES53_112115 [Roseimicrobium gellanilyticum]|uniref:Uncharacterized protein n=1 Tax=Roseimicrobium gellanilyticum TaxID=748857 RepID=A0A366HAD6_9BACT|nr:hypothetical protein [Roseimicrobium gellanilyticum]RBP38117.1 hypothetical protein DES53_112115 [Roseimicrobium gellanilyticum]
MSTRITEHTLLALQASSLLGFMASLGAFFTLGRRPEYAASRMRWVPQGSSYCPVFQTPGIQDADALLTCLHEHLSAAEGHRVITFEKDLKVSQAIFRNLSREMAESFLEQKDSFGSEMAAAFGSDGAVNEEGMIEDTAFRTMSGAGHQHFLSFMNELAKETNIDHLREALYGPWRYRDPSPIMRWDDADDRRYALRWDEPSKDPVRTVRGANRLAIAALPLFPTVPTAGGGLATVGFKGNKSNNTFVTWPIWTGWLSMDAVRSTLVLSELQKSEPSTSELSARGICAAFRSQRITLGKYRNFTPAKPI